MTELEREQAYVDGLYARVDELRAQVAEELSEALRERGVSARDLVEREARVDRLTERAVALDHAENGLCFGRLDLDDGQARHIGRTGLRGPAPDRTPLLLDWRAPGARPFYVATPADNHGVVRRRHLRTDGRRVEALEDELLDLDVAPGSVQLQGEGALMAALTEHRTGRMRDIVTTLQAEQDEVVRAGTDGVLVVQGGPGTGKTAVALHRAAYLLYAQPSVARRGVLVVGPTPTFLDYIEQVLPSLGETQVVLTTPETLVPGVAPVRREEPAVERLKGDIVMAEVLARAVRARQAPRRRRRDHLRGRRVPAARAPAAGGRRAGPPFGPPAQRRPPALPRRGRHRARPRGRRCELPADAGRRGGPRGRAGRRRQVAGQEPGRRRGPGRRRRQPGRRARRRARGAPRGARAPRRPGGGRRARGPLAAADARDPGALALRGPAPARRRLVGSAGRRRAEPPAARRRDGVVRRGRPAAGRGGGAARRRRVRCAGEGGGTAPGERPLRASGAALERPARRGGRRRHGPRRRPPQRRRARPPPR
ncbi:HelD family protein [Georgenia sp. SUBG003]|uniref:HelD family protein n=1 Tax=Georgenia sp. SUBG003 TaxID=1497974 RepID=UPI000B0F7D81